MVKKEVLKDVKGYEGYYQVSSLGRVRSLDRIITTANGVERFYGGNIIKGSIDKGYRQTTLRGKNIGSTLKISQIVAMAFLNHTPNGHTLVIDHINGDKSDDRLENLRIVTHRANTSTCFRSNKGFFSSKYVGVFWSSRESKWISKIRHNSKEEILGSFDCEVEASNAYKDALLKIKSGVFNSKDYRPKFISKFKGVSFNKKRNKWIAYITVNGKSKYLGSFKTELEAHKTYQIKSI